MASRGGLPFNVFAWHSVLRGDGTRLDYMACTAAARKDSNTNTNKQRRKHQWAAKQTRQSKRAVEPDANC